MGIAMMVAVVAPGGAFAISQDASGAQAEKRLFTTRWWQEQGQGYDWMTLSTSQPYYLCGESEDDCEQRWSSPTNAAISNWNHQDTTVEIDKQPDQNELYDLNIYIGDVILEDISILGLSVQYDETGEFCFEDCTVWFGEVYGADFMGEFLAPEYGTKKARQATMVHEIGHQLALAHESIDADEYPSYACETDITGAIPVSIMAYNCIDPVDLGGRGLFEVQRWDVCGVNHAYYDEEVGLAGCEDTTPPTPAPTSTPEASPPPGPTIAPGAVAWGDADCNGSLATRDGQAILRVVLGQNTLSQTQPCNPIGAAVVVEGFGDLMWADADCNGTITTRDNQAILRVLLGQNALSQTQPCPAVGENVAVSG
jgi:hypothetical protein